VNGERVADLGALDVDRPGERVALGLVEVAELVALLDGMIAVSPLRLDEDRLALLDPNAWLVRSRVLEDDARPLDAARCVRELRYSMTIRRASDGCQGRTRPGAVVIRWRSQLSASISNARCSRIAAAVAFAIASARVAWKPST
jgi:hypothetical protein